MANGHANGHSVGVNWQAIGRALAAPFPAEDVEWRVAGGKAEAGKSARIVPYLRTAAVMERLDVVCGLGGWSFELEPVVVAGGELQVARGRLTIYGVTRDGIGTASSWEPSKGCASDALKRAAALFGVGRYLAQLPPVTCTLDRGGNIPHEMLERLATRLAARTLAAECAIASA